MISLGFLEEGNILARYFSTGSEQYLKVSTLAVHVFCVQFGIQSLAGQLTDILLPSASKAILKGLIRTIQALTLLIFVTIMKQFDDHLSFWVMAIGLICVSPILYMHIPELKNLGRTAGEFFFLPCQTIFYCLLPWNNAKRKWSKALDKIKAANEFSKKVRKRSDFLKLQEEQEKWLQWKSVEDMCNKNKNITIMEDTIEELDNNERLQIINRDRVCFVTNMLGQNGYLNQNERPSRICYARGPVKFHNGPFQCIGAIRKGGIFLFDDLVLVARKLVKNRRYMNEMVIEFKDNFSMMREGSTLTLFSDKIAKGVKIHLETDNNACLWEKYCNFCNKNWKKTPEAVDSENSN